MSLRGRKGLVGELVRCKIVRWVCEVEEVGGWMEMEGMLYDS